MDSNDPYRIPSNRQKGFPVGKKGTKLRRSQGRLHRGTQSVPIESWRKVRTTTLVFIVQQTGRNAQGISTIGIMRCISVCHGDPHASPTGPICSPVSLPKWKLEVFKSPSPFIVFMLCWSIELHQNRYKGTDTYNEDVNCNKCSASPSCILGAAADRNRAGLRWKKGRRGKQILRYCNVGKNCSRLPQLISCSCAKAIAEGGKACACATLIHPRAIEDDKTGGRGKLSTCKLSPLNVIRDSRVRIGSDTGRDGPSEELEILRRARRYVTSAPREADSGSPIRNPSTCGR